MLFKTAATLLAFAGLAAAQTTPELTHGVAKINMNNVTATFTFDKVAGGVNVTVNVASGLTEALAINKTSGFEYHVHVSPVGPGNNCTSTGAHLDPLKIGTATPCDKSNFALCQEGDLAGKHGNLIPDSSSQVGALSLIQYTDAQLTFTGDGAITGRSIVIHNNGTRIACADLVVDGYVAPAPTPLGTGSSTSTTKPNSAAKLVGSVALTGFVALMMMTL